MVMKMSECTLEDVAKALVALPAGTRVATCGHLNPDGDCRGSVLGITLALRSLGLECTPILAEDAPAKGQYAFLPGTDGYATPGVYAESKGAPDVFFALDVPNSDRLKDAEALFNEAGLTIGVDHHPDTEDYASVTVSDPAAAATGILVWELIGLLGVKPTPEMATCCYLALMTDTGRFQYQNTDARALSSASSMVAAGASPSLCAREAYQNRSIASLKLDSLTVDRMVVGVDGRFAYSWVTPEDMERLGATKDDVDGLTDILRSLQGVAIAAILRVQGDGTIRGSLRAKDDTDVSAVAHEFDGGGHRAAAGFTYTGSLDALIARLEELLGKGEVR